MCINRACKKPENAHSFAYIQEKINHTVKYFKKIFACIIGVYEMNKNFHTFKKNSVHLQFGMIVYGFGNGSKVLETKNKGYEW